LVACGHTASPRVEVVETQPIETGLDTELRDAADVWPHLIASARRTIDVAQFYVSNAPASRLEPVIAAIETASRAGVRVRFLADRSFEKIYPDTLVRLRTAGVQLRLLDLSESDAVLHAKYFVIDGGVAFVGSQNFDWRALEHNEELGAIVRDAPAVTRLAALFDVDWARAGNEPPVARSALPASSSSVELVASPRDALPAGVRWDLPVLVDMLDHARTQIRVHLLTYKGGDWDELDRPVRAAVARGVRVEIAVADWATRTGTLPSLQALASAGVDVRIVSFPAWSGGFIPYARVAHAKLLVVDGARGWLGTSNWERGYFYGDRNVGLVFNDRATVRALLAFSERVWTSRFATRFDPARTYVPPRIE
jgi:phosphatidylserine/phosphatidylglycerophosphate/cardiolipin synthase-like enzyme